MTHAAQPDQLLEKLKTDLENLLEHRGIKDPLMIGIHTGGVWHEIVAEAEPQGDDDPASVELPLAELSAGKILYEPHPAVIRSGAFGELCRQLNARLIDPHIAYLLSSTLRDAS